MVVKLVVKLFVSRRLRCAGEVLDEVRTAVKREAVLVDGGIV